MGLEQETEFYIIQTALYMKDSLKMALGKVMGSSNSITSRSTTEIGFKMKSKGKVKSETVQLSTKKNHSIAFREEHLY